MQFIKFERYGATDVLQYQQVGWLRSPALCVRAQVISTYRCADTLHLTGGQSRPLCRV